MTLDELESYVETTEKRRLARVEEMRRLNEEYEARQAAKDDQNDPGPPDAATAERLLILTRQISKLQRTPMKDIRLAIDTKHSPCLVGVILRDGVIKEATFKAIHAAGLRCCLNICVAGEDNQILRDLTPWRAWRKAFMHPSRIATVRMD